MCSTKFRCSFFEKKSGHNHYTVAALVFVTVFFVQVDEIQSARLAPLRIGRQQDASDTSEDDGDLGRIIKAKRQNYNTDNGVVDSRFPFEIAISEPFLGENKRRDLTQEQHIKFNVSQKIEALGYYGEEHTVETEDGYFLTLFRMRNPNCKKFSPRAPVLFMHGVLDSADTWFVLDVESGAPYQTANDGYDVWIGNVRGNHYAQRHRTLSPKDPKFWNFSWHEIGTRDLPAIFQHILDHTKETNKRQMINYVGHSMGTTIFFVCLSSLPDWNKKMDFFVALPPSAFLSATTSPLAALKPYSKLYNTVLTDGPFLTSEIDHLISKTFRGLCPINITVGQFKNESLCNLLVYLGQGNSREDTNGTILQRVFGHFPSTTSKKLIAHFVQLVGEDRFTQFDYGSALENFKRYGQTYPPSYKLYNADVAGVSYYGQRDVLIDHKDSEENLRQMGNVRAKFYVLVMDYSHLDFIWGNSAGTAVTARFLKALASYYDGRKVPMFEPDFSQTARTKKLADETDCNCSCDGGFCYADFEDEDMDDEVQRLLRVVDSEYPFPEES